jgi:hypothetical protein
MVNPHYTTSRQLDGHVARREKKKNKKFRVLQWTTMEDAMMNGMEWKGKGNELGTQQTIQLRFTVEIKLLRSLRRWKSRPLRNLDT